MVDSVKLLNAANAYNVAKSQNAAEVTSALVPVGDIGIKPTESAFSTLVSESIDKATTTIKAGEGAAIKGLVGEANLADLATAVTDAELTLRTVISVRDRIISAYQDIIKMPI